ncbi:MAG TPA: dihydroneopterin triphosphate diphosphatase [Gammaproteobacteria bacterium]|nr:dihydroneopterin triphosphate diphosphatase [Gammaproteobacteria bacterium]
MAKRPESVLVVVHTAHGEVLQLHRREPADFWQSITGSLLDNETPRQAAQRELREETGFIADTNLTDSGIVNRYPIHPAWRDQYAEDVHENTEYVFTFELPTIDAVTLNPDEHTEYDWLSRDAAAERASSMTDREAIRKLVTVIPV